MNLEIAIGNREGRYFTEWRFDLLRDLLERIHEGPCPPSSEVVEIEHACLWYDAEQDFHRLSFQARGHAVEVQFYKVFGCEIDGVEHWSGCPRGGDLRLRREHSAEAGSGD